jgi:calcineurin-like phosphoesterase family protein
MTELKKHIYFTSDWHINHANVITYSNRPFTDVDHMSRVLVNNYNSIVPDNAVCYFLGDMGMGKGEHITNVIKQLKGTKVLILGNHDNPSNSMYNKGFDVVLYAARLQIAGQTVTMSHCPLLGVPRENTTDMKGSKEGENWHGELNPKRRPFTHQNYGQFHLHGHIHSSPNSGKSKKIQGRQYDVGVDANNYRPISQGQIESWIAHTLREEQAN